MELKHSPRPSGIFPLLRIAAALITFTVGSTAADFQPGDTVKLTRNEPLLFRDKPLRDGMEGETFSVLAHRPEAKRIYFLQKDQDGKDIAVSVPEDAVEVTAKAATKLREQAAVAAKAGRLEDATRLILQALKADPKDSDSLTLNRAIITLSAARQALEKAKKQQTQAGAVASAKRKNAKVIDRPNPLAPNDTSNQARAAAMREEAQSIEAEAKAAVDEAQSRYQAALASISTPAVAQPQRVGGSSTMTMDRLAKDPATNPNPTVARTPSFEETIDFINSKIKGHQQRIWFGQNSKRLLVHYESFGQILAVEPAKMLATIKIETLTNAAIGVAQAWVRMECVGSSDEAEIFTTDGKRTKANSFAIELDDPVDRNRVATACQHLLEISGAKKEAF